jgi:hypothetical protein
MPGIFSGMPGSWDVYSVIYEYCCAPVMRSKRTTGGHKI